MKKPINYRDIKAGDLVRWERGDGYAIEFRAERDRDLRAGTSGQHYLLDRPKPRVDLPLEPTLGVLKWNSNTSGEKEVLATWSLRSTYDQTFRDVGPYALSDVGHRIGVQSVTSFTPMVAIRRDLVDELVAGHSGAALPSQYIWRSYVNGWLKRAGLK